ALDTAGSYAISASCGNTVAIKIAIVELTHQTVVEEPQNKDRTKLGVGEQVVLTVMPEDITEPITWNASNGSLAENGNSQRKLTCPNRKSTVTVTAVIKSLTLSQTFDIVEPGGVVMVKQLSYGVRHIKGNPSVGYKANVHILPSDVSFVNVRFQEKACPAVQFGYMTLLTIPPHPQGEYFGEESHYDPNGQWVGIDTIEFGLDASMSPQPYYPGYFTWSIPWVFKVVGDVEEKQFATVVQKMSIDGFGTMSGEKLGASHSIPIDASDSNYNQ
ncbi:MAG: hypothetical protein HP043_03470, partial [Dialister sp.]|nr:hypothetical protein [Dialister sp.]